jgi:hypothetical protein
MTVARQFWPTTAELVVDVVAAVSASGRPTAATSVAQYVDNTEDAAKNALHMAVDLGLLHESGASFEVSSALCNFARTPDAKTKAAVVRVALEAYEPFLRFRERLLEGFSVDRAAQQASALLDLTATRTQIADTLVSLGTFAGAIASLGGGQYRVIPPPEEAPLLVLALSAGDEAAAEALIRQRLDPHSPGIPSRNEVVLPLAKALLRAKTGDGDGAVLDAGNAVESFLVEYGQRVGLGLTTQNGINSKVNELRTHNKLPSKLVGMSGYLGHLRNAADHGVDPDIGSAWTIGAKSGLEYVFVACSFITSVLLYERNAGHVL